MIFELSADAEGLLDADSEIGRLRRRDPDALAALVARYQHRLYRYLLRLVRDPAAADDLFQQTWLRAVEKLRQYDARRSFEAWLFAIARNLTIDHLRRRRHESLDEPGNGGPLAERLRSGKPNVLEGCLQSERVALVMDGMAELPPASREVLTLRFEEEMKLTEIADLTGVPLATVKSRLRRAMIQLRQRLAQ